MTAKPKLVKIEGQGDVEHISNGRAREYWAKTINEKWQEQVPTILETGRRLEEAQCELSAADFKLLCNNDLNMNKTTAEKLIAVATNDNINALVDAAPHQLPAAWTILHQLTHVDDKTFADAARDGRIHPKMKTADAIALAPPKQKRPRQTVEATPPPAPPPPANDDDEIDAVTRFGMLLHSRTMTQIEGIPLDRWPDVIREMQECARSIEKELKERRGSK